MSCLINIGAQRDQMSANDKKIADYLLDNSVLLRDYSSQQLASAVGVSQSSIVKFCQKLGYKGYPDLKWAINEDVAINIQSDQGTVPHFDHQQLNEISDRLLQGKLTAVTSTINHNEAEPFIQASTSLSQASRVYVNCAGSSSYLGDYLVYQLLCSGKVAMHSQDPIQQQNFIEHLQAKDVVVHLSHGLGSQLGAKTLLQLTHRGIKTIAIGRCHSQNKTEPSDITLCTLAESRGDSDYTKAYERAAQQHVIDLLLLMMAESQTSLD